MNSVPRFGKGLLKSSMDASVEYKDESLDEMLTEQRIQMEINGGKSTLPQ